MRVAAATTGNKPTTTTTAAAAPGRASYFSPFRPPLVDFVEGGFSHPNSSRTDGRTRLPPSWVRSSGCGFAGGEKRSLLVVSSCSSFPPFSQDPRLHSPCSSRARVLPVQIWKRALLWRRGASLSHTRRRATGRERDVFYFIFSSMPKNSFLSLYRLDWRDLFTSLNFQVLEGVLEKSLRKSEKTERRSLFDIFQNCQKALGFFSTSLSFWLDYDTEANHSNRPGKVCRAKKVKKGRIVHGRLLMLFLFSETKPVKKTSVQQPRPTQLRDSAASCLALPPTGLPVVLPSAHSIELGTFRSSHRFFFPPWVWSQLRA